MAANSESLLCEMVGGSNELPPPKAVLELPPTTYSLLDMDLAGCSKLASPLTPQNVDNSNENEGLQLATPALKESMEKMSKEITAHVEQVAKTLTNLFLEKQKEVVKHVYEQLE